jgi:hypothetical protein
MISPPDLDISITQYPRFLFVCCFTGLLTALQWQSIANYWQLLDSKIELYGIRNNTTSPEICGSKDFRELTLTLGGLYIVLTSHITVPTGIQESTRGEPSVQSSTCISSATTPQTGPSWRSPSTSQSRLSSVESRRQIILRHLDLKLHRTASLLPLLSLLGLKQQPSTSAGASRRQLPCPTPSWKPFWPTITHRS